MASDDWREIPGYEGLYWVNSDSQIKNRNNLVMKQVVRESGNRRGRQVRAEISLSKNGKMKTYYAHRLVAVAFLGSPPGKDYQVDHIDGDSTNNSLENLRWVTPSENRRWVEGRRDQRIEELEKENKKLKRKIEKLEKKLEGVVK